MVIAYGEQLADEVAASTVDNGLWRQAWTAVARALPHIPDRIPRRTIKRYKTITH